LEMAVVTSSDAFIVDISYSSFGEKSTEILKKVN